MQKALQTFINEIRSAIDEEVIPEKQMVALANNYFKFKDFVNDFYNEKFGPSLAHKKNDGDKIKDLSEKTKDAYEKIVKSYKEVSMIVLDKLSYNVSFYLDSECEGRNLLTVKPDAIVNILYIYHENYQKLVHMAFIKKLHERFVSITHTKILDLLCMELKKKKKPVIKDLIKCLHMMRDALMEIFE